MGVQCGGAVWGCSVGVQCGGAVLGCSTRLPERGGSVGGELQREEAAPLTQQLVHLGLLRRCRHEYRTHLLRVSGGGEGEGGS